ncbi:hypothetical protein GLAREA_01469 [Glarea lozoyensis ATCC 20868]|uniref:Uncharacterized protein n=1 Tax=Glarea lozoyensis (strain ATCC 20868 / MF5171) TaxID=1116229 RepID=S3CGA4_GLAL2|nr:uncharacterized protein GLAREA_01469 [Glarea lozoyensis ATCC 20868]EPE25557.1 hypothetical protein GLAREA_01469 [Glarea lozoyensis ATCC 20868]
MPAFQRTFNLIPANPSNVTAKPPMTSKAAKKAYLKANRGPRVSRAEQRRLEKEELEQQKREYEKERNAARAKLAREKKAAKLAEEKEERRKLGIPEPNRFVRASQPTISMFARQAGKRTWQQIEMDSLAEESEDTLGEELLPPMEKSVDQPPAKRVAVEQDSEDEFGCFPSMSQAGDLLEIINSSNASIPKRNTISKPSSSLVDHASQGSWAVPAIQEPALLRDEDEIVNAIDIKSRHDPLDSLRRKRGPLIQKPSMGPKKSQELPKRNAKQLFDENLISSQELLELVTTQVHSEAAEAEAKCDPVTGTPVLQHPPEFVVTEKSISPKDNGQGTGSTILARSQARGTPDKASLPLKHTVQKSPVISPRSRPMQTPSPTSRLPVDTAVCSKQAVTKPVTKQPVKSMPPPPVPAKSRKPIYLPNPSSLRLTHLRNLGKKNDRQAEILPPTATQLFLENNLDDFFPSPSQEARELLDDIEDFPSNTQIAKEISPIRSALCFKPSLEPIDDSFADLFSTQDFASSQELLEITTPSRPPPARSMSKRSFVTSTSARHSAVTRSRLPLQSSSGNAGHPGFTNNTSQSRGRHHNSSASKASSRATENTPRSLQIVYAPKPDVPSPRPKTIEYKHQKDVMVLHKPPPVPPKIPLDPKHKRRFFQEKEEDLVQAAIYESKKVECNRKAQEKVREAQQEVKRAAPAVTTRSGRTLQRVQSNVTDYDDDDFISSQDLLALC